MGNPYTATIAKLDGLLAFHRNEIAELEQARRILVRINGGEEAAAAEAAPVKQKRKSPGAISITVRKTSANFALPGSMSRRVLDFMKNRPNTPIAARQVIIGLGLSPSDRNGGGVYGTLTDLRRKGFIEWDDDHNYTLAGEPPSARPKGRPMTERLIDFLGTASEPLEVARIKEAMHLDPLETKLAYQSLSNLKMKGVVVAEGEPGSSRYSLARPQTPDAPPAGPPQ